MFGDCPKMGDGVHLTDCMNAGRVKGQRKIIKEMSFSRGSSRGSGGFGGRGGSRGGGFGASRSFAPQCPPDSVLEMGSFMHATEGEMVCKSVNVKIPYFNAPIYLENKTMIGKVDEILGPINEVYFTVKMQDGMVAASFKASDKVYIAPDKLLPIDRFLPKPKGAKIEKPRGGAAGRGGRGGARGGRGGFAPRGRGGSSSFSSRGGRGGSNGFSPRGAGGGGFSRGGGGFSRGGRGGF